jgi:hypothetical protein
MKRCSTCNEMLPLDQFRTRKHRSGNVSPTADCNGCHKQYNQSLRRRDAQARGKRYRTSEDITAERLEREERIKASSAAKIEAQRSEKLQRARELLAQVEEEQRRRAVPSKPMPHARALGADLLARVKAVAFWRRAGRVPGAGCWEWQGGRKGRGEYGTVEIYLNGKRVRVFAHRVAWGLTHGPIAEGLCVLHHCDNPPCVRPDHLFLGTPQDNADDMVAKGREAYPAGTMPPHVPALLSRNNGRIPGGRAERNVLKRNCPRCGGPLVASKHASQKGRRRCRACTTRKQAEYMRKWKAKRALEAAE